MGIETRFHSEYEIDNFSIDDGTIPFYLMVKALYRNKPQLRVLDYGGGRAQWFYDDPSETRRELRDLRTGAAETVAADIDDVVLSHPCSDRQIVVTPDRPLPFKDNYFDIIVADQVFEHIVTPAFAAAEMLRVLKPNGWICARTTNKYCYVAFASMLMPNRLHKAVLHLVQPGRRDEDVFPTTHSLCTARAIHKYFSGRRIIISRMFSHPNYHFDNALVYRFLVLLHRLLPSCAAPILYAFIQK